MTQDTSQLEYAIQHFHNEYTPSLYTLADKLNEAGISHYSSGCGLKKATYDIFPASHYVYSLVALVSLSRHHRSKSAGTGLKDCSVMSEYNPAHQFMQYLGRWSGFAEEIMRKEGDSARGVAAAQAKLLMESLIQKLSAKSALKPSRLGAKLAAISREMDFYELMRNIGRWLEIHHHATGENTKSNARQRMQQNYQKALQAADANLREPVTAEAA